MKTITEEASGDRQHQHPAGDERRRALIEAACELIVEKGFEGLRVRDIAAKVGINHATLHYYFPTKEALIRAVLDGLVAQIKRESGADEAAMCDAGRPLRDRLGVHFNKILGLMETRPELFIALNELQLRGLRDPETAAILKERDEDWREFLSNDLREGQQDGSVRAEVDPDAAAQAVMVLFKGVTLHLRGRAGEARRVVAQMERWLFVQDVTDQSSD